MYCEQAIRAFENKSFYNQDNFIFEAVPRNSMFLIIEIVEKQLSMVTMLALFLNYFKVKKWFRKVRITAQRNEELFAEFFDG